MPFDESGHVDWDALAKGFAPHREPMHAAEISDPEKIDFAKKIYADFVEIDNQTENSSLNELFRDMYMQLLYSGVFERNEGDYAIFDSAVEGYETVSHLPENALQRAINSFVINPKYVEIFLTGIERSKSKSSRVHLAGQIQDLFAKHFGYTLQDDSWKLSEKS